MRTNSKMAIAALVVFVLSLVALAFTSSTNDQTAQEQEITQETLQDTSTQEETGTTEEITQEETTPEVAETEATSESSDYVVTHTGTLTLMDDREIKFELYGEIAPITVANFVKLANEGFYDGIIFHRVIENFMIQGGCPLGLGIDGSDETIVGEFSQNGIDNPILHERGVISMARSSSFDSASSQFFIMHQDYPSLDGAYAAFGKVTEGIEVVDAIATVETTLEPQTGSTDKPLVDVVIKTITIEEQ